MSTGKEELRDPEDLPVRDLKELMRKEGIDVDNDPEVKGALDKDDLVLLLRRKVPKYAKFDVHHKGDDYAQKLDEKQIGEHYKYDIK